MNFFNATQKKSNTLLYLYRRFKSAFIGFFLKPISSIIKMFSDRHLSSIGALFFISLRMGFFNYRFKQTAGIFLNCLTAH